MLALGKVLGFAAILCLLVEGRRPSLRIGSFNVRSFGVETMRDDTVVDILKQTIRRYDVVLIQEIRDVSNTSIYDLLDIVNYRLWNGRKYRMEISPRLGRSRSKEQYAFIYREHKVEILGRPALYNDEEDRFEREPYAVHIKPLQTGMKTKRVILIGCHIKPDDAKRELGELIEVYNRSSVHFNNPNAILMGDFNADCRYIRTRHFHFYQLKQDPRFLWLIDDDQDTTVSSTNCAYDRFIVVGEEVKRNVVPRSARVLRFDETYGLPIEKALKVSDHYPIEMRIY